MSSYFIIKQAAFGQLESKKSRFLAYLKPTPSKAAARRHLVEIKAKHPDAGHHCWAYIAGPPHNSGTIGISDDREPHNTAGRPMLNILQHRNIGDIAAVVVRYRGGTKLGTGGLARAYSGAVQTALDNVEIIRKITMAKLDFEIDFAAEAAVRRKLESLSIPVPAPFYSDKVKFSIKISVAEREKIIAELNNTVNGHVAFHENNQGGVYKKITPA